MAIYQAPQIWGGRNDGEAPDVQRWHQAIRLLDMTSAEGPAAPGTSIALLGFCSDEGVRRNKGRTGAKEAPDAIRLAISNFAVHHDHVSLFDAGNIACDDGNLESAQMMLGAKVRMLIGSGYLPVVLGGGHEVAYANFRGIYPFAGSSNNFAAINFDAHFDLREIDAEVGATSGTGFWQMAQEVKRNNHNFEYLVLGLQECSNTRKLFQTAAALDAMHVPAEAVNPEQLEHLLHLVNGVLYQSSLVQLSIDMDVFNVAVAPGVSAPAVNGIAPDKVFKHLLRHIVTSGKLCAIDIAEVNPLYDIDNRTARLAASFIFEIAGTLERHYSKF